MIWLTWRQHRIEAAVVLGTLAVLAALLAAVGLDMHNTYQQLGLANCLSEARTSPNCGDALEGFRIQFGFWLAFTGWLNLIPALLGILVGAPLVARELEHGTHRLVWTQGVTRARWLAVKLALVLGGCLVVALAVSLLLTWWRQPWDALSGRFGNAGFDFEGTAILGYVLFALALAVAAGALLSRAIPAMVVTLAGFLAVRLPIEFHFRPLYQAPLTATFDVLTRAGAATLSRADWDIDSYLVDHAGHQLSDQQVYGACLSGFNTSKDTFFQCVHDHGWLAADIYQPASRYWTFQGIETAIFAGIAVVLLALTIWWVVRRIG